ncbi:MAG: Fe-S cluster assembly ATPase SufC [Clostridia bacterium]|nr:Fe-S cluster assembly ATPase SufC [Clostridia bacterium]
MKTLLQIENLCVKSKEKQILKGLTLKIGKGETHIIMGPNGAGKSTLLNAILNNPAYEKTEGKIIFDGADITDKKTDEIARMGVFMSFQNPQEIEGISTFNFIKSAKQKRTNNPINYFELSEELEENATYLQMNQGLLTRDLNVGFSGGEKKKNEILQLLELNPKLAILDETDSGLDVDAINIVSKGINAYKNEDNAILLVTHSSKMLEKLKPDFVHILVDGQIVATGGTQLLDEVLKNGYKNFKKGV